MMPTSSIGRRPKTSDACKSKRVKREAEQYVEAVDGDGNEKESVEAAATAFDFDRAEAETEELLIKTTGEADEA